MSPIFFRDRSQLAQLTTKYRFPAMFGLREWPDRGGLVSSGARISDRYERTATYVDEILKGANPAELPVEQPTKLELVINERTAKAVGVTMPASLLLRADHIIR
jgi:putative tryptophan/tyrosine transport system substrate-binding protein